MIVRKSIREEIRDVSAKHDLVSSSHNAQKIVIGSRRHRHRLIKGCGTHASKSLTYRVSDGPWSTGLNRNTQILIYL